MAVDAVNPSLSFPWFLGQVLGAMRCKANGWTLHSRMEMEKLEEFSVILLPIRENKAVEMEIVCHRYEEGLKVSVCFTVMMKAMLKCKRLRAGGEGRRIGIEWRCGGQIKWNNQSTSSSSSVQCAAVLTDEEKASFLRGFCFIHHYFLNTIKHVI